MKSTRNQTILGNTRRSVGDPSVKYESLSGIYKINRAALSGERYVKDLDNIVRPDNILLPFNPSMSQAQYDWYKCEAEWPGFVETYARTLVGGLLRKPPQLTLPDDAPEEAYDWLMNNFSRQNGTLVSFLDAALWEEMNTNRAFVCVNYPVTNPDEFTPDELQPYPILLAGESIINWSTGINPASNKEEITRLVIRMFRSRQSTDSDFHDDYIDTTWVHELDPEGYYQITVYEASKESSAATPVIAGKIQQDYVPDTTGWEVVDQETNILRNGERLNYIPIFPLNGHIEPMEPMLSGMINRERGLYNRISRRNHLLYGTAAYTPVVSASNLGDDEKDEIVNAGLGSWIFLPDDGGSIDILAAPTDALTHLDRSIEGTIQEMARLGMRILSPENDSTQSGVALEIRNAAQTSQLATLNQKISNQVKLIILTMVNWRYGTEYTEEDIQFTLSADFNPAPLGADWMRLVSEWYEGGLISKSAFLEVAKQNDILPADYDDEAAQEEIEQDPNVFNAEEGFQNQMELARARPDDEDSSSSDDDS